MKKALIALALVGLGLSGCGNAGKETTTNKKQYKYVCTMHPEIGADKPGTCSKCGMDLIENEAAK
jgi:uncharacterized lipoprotein NlpE involved in copper resistance